MARTYWTAGSWASDLFYRTDGSDHPDWWVPGESWEPGRRIDSKDKEPKRFASQAGHPGPLTVLIPPEQQWDVRSKALRTSSLADAGRRVVAMNPRYTSQRCSHCGHIAAENRDKEKFACISCGHSEHADINAARNILRAGLAQGGSEAFLVNAEPVSR
jgi:predicted RNA-binding Zn-ribbon protein involved in translation (DUF1610 family)